MAEFSGWGFAVGDIRGTRAWLTDGSRLLGISYRQVWVPGENHAECRRLKRIETFPAPFPSSYPAYQSDPCTGMDPACGCGFYAYLRGHNDYLANAVRGLSSWPIAGGVIRGWGKTVVGDRGFRTEKAEILALHVPPTTVRDYYMVSLGLTRFDASVVVERLHAAYHVPVYTDWDALLRRFPPTEPEVRPTPQEATS